MEQTAEQRVKAKWPRAIVVSFGHGKVAIYNMRKDGQIGRQLSNITCLGTRERRREEAWQSAASRIESKEAQ